MKATEDTIERRRSDADELIREALAKVPREKKLEVLRLVEGYAICAQTDKEAG